MNGILAPVQLPAEDRPHAIGLGPIRGIPIIEDDDPRFVEERAAMSAASQIAHGLHTADELLWGLRHHDWRVRHESVARLVGRARQDARTLPALLRTAGQDTSWQVRDAAVWALMEFETGAVLPVLQASAHDFHHDVRWSAQFALFQKGHGPFPDPLDPRSETINPCEFIDQDRTIGDHEQR